MGGLRRGREGRWTARTAVGVCCEMVYCARGPGRRGCGRLPRKDKAEVGRGGVSPPLSGPTATFSCFGLGWRRLEYFMQKAMANEVSTARPGKKKGQEGEGEMDRSLEHWKKLSFSATGFHFIWEILESRCVLFSCRISVDTFLSPNSLPLIPFVLRFLVPRVKWFLAYFSRMSIAPSPLQSRRWVVETRSANSGYWRGFP